MIKRNDGNIRYPPNSPSFNTEEERLIGAFQKTFINAAVKEE